jgi:uncharacterized protein
MWVRNLRVGAAAALLVLMGAGNPPQEQAAETVAPPKFEDGYEAYQRGEFGTAREIWEPLAKSGDLRAQYNLGLIWSEGRGVRPDKTKAVDWWKRAAEGGHVRAMHNLALAHIAGIPDKKTGHTVQDYDAALTWLGKAAEKDFPNSLYSLGKMYQYGLGVKQDDARAASLFMKSAEQGFVRAQYNLAKAYRDGAGVKRNTDESLRWFLAAAEGGYAKAQYKMAMRLVEGQGTEADIIEALKWCLLAARHGNKEARDWLDDLVLQASLPELQEATRRASELEVQEGSANRR